MQLALQLENAIENYNFDAYCKIQVAMVNIVYMYMYMKLLKL